MAQKLILCEAAMNKDILATSPAIAGYLEDGYVVSSVSGFTSRENRNMCFVLLSKTEEEPASEETPAEETPAANGEGENSGSETTTTTETEPAAEGGE